MVTSKGMLCSLVQPAHFRAKETVDKDSGITVDQQKGRDTLLLVTLCGLPCICDDHGPTGRLWAGEGDSTNSELEDLVQ